MRRTTILTAAPLLGLVLLSPATGATAAGETCRGEAATLVGTRGSMLVGTEGRDVVVTNGTSKVTTMGGDDLVCIPDGTPRTLAPSSASMSTPVPVTMSSTAPRPTPGVPT